MFIVRIEPTIDVDTPLGIGRAVFLIDYGLDTNTIWVVRLSNGKVKHIESEDILILPNKMIDK
jgi:hypothetical protein